MSSELLRDIMPLMHHASEAAEITVLCAEDEVIIGLELQQVIDEQPGMRCVGVLDSADSLPDEIARKSPRIVLLDLTMPGRNPLEVLAETAFRHPETRAVVFSGYDDRATVQQAIDAGAWGFVVKRGDTDAVIKAIRKVADGEFVLPAL